MSWFITNLIATVLMPPLSLLLMLALGIVMLYRHRRFAKPLILVSAVLLWLSSTPYFAEGAMHWLEGKTAALGSPPPADAVVILGGGTYFRAPEYGGTDTVSSATLERLRYGVKLQRETGKPILVTGGKPLGNERSEAQQMRDILEQEFHVPVRWTEDTSDNTFENAYHSSAILKQEGVRRIYLVTHAWHMPRSAGIFRRAGFEVVEAPTAFTTRYQIDMLAFLPNAVALQNSKHFIHEVIGLMWYQARHLFSDK